MALTATTHRRPAASENPPEGTGCSPGTWLHVTVPGEDVERSPRPAWISDALLARTIEVWSRAYGRQLDEDDAIEILENVGRLAEALLDAKRRMRK